MIIGAQKAGTTSLKNYLYQHPQIESHYQTEFSYFSDPKEFKLGYDDAFSRYISKTDLPSEKKLIAKYAGLYATERGLKLLHDHNPDVTIVLILRNPVERAYSAYNMEHTYNTDWMNKDFEGMLDIISKKQFEDPMYKLFIQMGLYNEYVEMVYRYFPKEKVKIYLFEEMKKDPLKICKELFEILGVDPHFIPDVSVIHNKSARAKNVLIARIIEKLRNNHNFIKKFAKNILPHETFTKIGYQLIEMNKSSKKKIEPLNPVVRAKFEDFFRPYNQKLADLTGMDLSIWEKKR
ncbi:MAG TPA: sulfotransferase domain-containing protein [Bacteroidia bacterium]|nr:sulfotransferase domain-containing protein [Bacteroidia bacterium]